MQKLGEPVDVVRLERGDVPVEQLPQLSRRANEARPRPQAEARQEVDGAEIESGVQLDGSTTISEFPSGSRSQNIGGTGPP